jgi:LCP family protein required for cell wall assembly
MRRVALALMSGSLVFGSVLALGPVASGADPSPLPSAIPGVTAEPCPSVDPAASPLASPSLPIERAGAPGVAASPGSSVDPATVASAAPASPGSTPDPCAAPPLIDLGKDGRLTVLLLGTDWRPDVPGERPDVIMVVSLDPVTKQVVAVSIPRDMVQLPLAKRNGGGTSGATRVNELYGRYRDPSLPHAKVDKQAVRRFKDDVATALAVEIDHWALTRFKGMGKMVERLGGVRVDIPETITDSGYGRTGAFFPAGDEYRLKGLQRCTMARPCRNPLIFARSRHGTVGDGYNSDFERARRQQELVMAAAARVQELDLTPRQLEILLSASRSRVWTDLPRSVEAAQELMALAEGAGLRPRDSAVFGPRKWAFVDGTTPLYAFRPNIRVIRDWMNDRFGTPPKGR